jgi:hypothetical protein
MHPIDIISHASKKAGVHPHAALKMANKRLGHDMKHVQQNDTLMFYKMLSPHSAFVHFVTADSALNLVHSLDYFMHMLEHNGVQEIYMNSKSKRIMHGLESVGVNLQKSDHSEYPLMGRLG